MEQFKLIYGDRVVIEPIIEKDEIEEQYQKDNPYKNMGSNQGIIIAIGEEVTCKMNIGDLVFFDNTITHKVKGKENYIIINASQLFINYTSNV